MTTHPPLPTIRPLLDPAPEYANWQSGEPIRRVAIWGDHTPWLITRYEDARTILADPRFSADANHPAFPHTRPGAPPQAPGLFHQMDPPDHTRLRRMLIPDFTFRRIEQLDGAIQRICDDLLDAMTAGGATEADLVASYALPLPTLAICELLGVPYKDRGFFRAKSSALTSVAGNPAEAMAARMALYGYLRALVERRVGDPADDLVSRLATERVATGEATPEEATGMISLLLLAGHETTANMFSLAVVALLENRAQLDALHADDSLWPSAVEELLRHLTVIHSGIRRIATEDVEVSGVRIGAGEGVIVALQAANRDPSAYPDPDVLDARRDASGHLAFGHGLHQCIGQSLARAELRLGLSTLFRTLPTLRLTASPDSLALSTSTVHGVQTLPVAWR
ncbi:cytochrome P450 [Streptomyces fuscichromogenes]|uniref:Cytochrome P450 n=1 Tax=Streptomyces fuscichromogenes TaxID=1324013 RepID=A0A917XFH2_9ACTN|nr:cytochrome P450 [Streptomyces fuscichromogenes]GGN19443.1 cytochrome P450 [Streptomyces fuscichromogenes]